MIKVEQFKAGNYRKGAGYQYFVPSLIHAQWTWASPEINDLLEKASLRLGELNAFSRFVPNIDLFIQLHVTKEAVVSSRIEGTQTNMTEALLPETEIDPERRDDWVEVTNYIKAMNQAIEQLDTLPLSGRLMKQTHATLLDRARGDHKSPGEYRRSQNWIGGLSLSDAVFIPPHADMVNELMSDLEHFLHHEELRIPDLIRIAIGHYQFETIHPFLDGNGRMGRLLITLYLVNQKILDLPLLYLSTFFEKDKALYYDNLMRVRQKNDMLHWIKYFLVGVEQASNLAIGTLRQVFSMKEESESLIQSEFGRRAHTGMALLQVLFHHPVTTVEDVMKATGLSFKAANDLVELMVRHQVLTEITRQARNRIFVFEKYLNAYVH